MPGIKAILFDFDGVIIDSEPVHAKAKRLVLEKFGITYPVNIFDDYKGRTDKVFFDHVANELDTGKRPAEIFLDSKNFFFDELVKEIKLIDGFLSFHKSAKEKGIRTAIVSSTTLYSFKPVDEIYKLTDIFDLVITGADTEFHKPHPAPYLKALERLSVKASDVIAIEDSPNGIISAKAAGCFVYGLTSSFQGTDLITAGADRIVESYEELARILEI
ncbi:MAG: HAD family phosphatase [Ferruginibacter sp.]